MIVRLSLLLLLILPAQLFAAGDMTSQSPQSIHVSLGDNKNRLRFYPDKFRFETGRLYKLVIKNTSKQKHYFSSEAMARAVFTRKVQVVDKHKRTLVEVKGIINEIEVYPGHTAEWWFVPIKTLNTGALKCSIKGHTEAGMTGQISIF